MADNRISISLAAGALFGEKPLEMALPDERMVGFLELHYHRVLPDPRRQPNDLTASLVVADDVIGGQFDLGFCSESCFKTFWDRVRDEFLTEIRDAEGRAQKAGACQPDAYAVK